MSENPIDKTEADDFPKIERERETPRQDRADDTVTETYRFSPSADAQDDQYQSGDMIGRYQIECLLGTGGFANVYRAVDTELERVVAIKVPRMCALSAGVDMTRYVEEAKAMAKLSHRNIVPVHDVVHESGMAIIVMKFIDGMTLRQRLDSGTIPIEQATHIIEQMATAIAFAHDHKVIHRDLKPQNILIDQTGHVYVTDFGLAIEFSQYATRKTEFAGTRDYMLPELSEDGLTSTNDDNWTSGKSDLWAMGVTAYEILTGSLPEIPRSKHAEKRTNGVQDPSELNPAVGTALSAFCQKSLAIDSSKRFQDAAGFLEAFQAASRISSKLPKPNLRRFQTACLVSLGLLLVFVTWTIVRHQGPQKNAFSKRLPQTALVDADPEDAFATKSDRDSAKFVIKSGGKVGLVSTLDKNPSISELSSLSDLPDYQFGVDWLMLVDMQKTDKMLKSLVGLKHIVGVDFCRSDISNEGLSQLSSFQSLRHGLFYGCNNLTDEGIACLLSQSQFVDLILSETQVGKETFDQLAHQKRLVELRLHRTAACDRVLESVRDLPTLTLLRVDYSKITDAGTHHLAKARSLQELGLAGNAITDKTLVHLHDLKQLRTLDLSDTNVTQTGVANLKAANPNLVVLVNK